MLDSRAIATSIVCLCGGESAILATARLWQNPCLTMQYPLAFAVVARAPLTLNP